VLFVLLNGCATATKTASKSYTFFPPAPDEPRLQFLTSFSSEVDLGRNTGFLDFVTGRRTSPNPLVKPYGLALKDGKVFVCDTMANAVEVFDLARKQARYFAPRGEGRLLMPINITIDGDGTRYVADTSRNQVVIFNKDGNYVAAMGVKDEMKPCDVAINANRLYVADLKGHGVRVYDKAQRKLLFSIPRDPKAAEGKLFSPTNLAIDKERGRLLVSDTGGFAVQVYDLEGKFLRTIGKQGVGFGAFARPKGVAVDRAGLAYVVDASTYVVQMFDPEGRLLLFFGQPGASTQGELALPAGVEIDYENAGLFQKYVAPGFECEYVILVTSQPPPSLGAARVSVYGFVKKK
jgi:DNA-binding beta-propeller fold protein YncE